MAQSELEIGGHQGNAGSIGTDQQLKFMNVNRVQIILACVAILFAAAVAPMMAPRISMAQTVKTLDFEKVIPRQFGKWKPVPDIKVIEPPGSVAYEIYDQEMGRGYVDPEGNVVMLLIAYGPSQSTGLQLHNPEICYAAQGFRVSALTIELLSYAEGLPPLPLKRLVAQRESRFEPLVYWMRVGYDIPTGLLARQITKVKYGLRGLIPDGTLVRVSTVGLAEEAAYKVEGEFIRDLLNAVDPATKKYLVGDPALALSSRL